MKTGPSRNRDRHLPGLPALCGALALALAFATVTGAAAAPPPKSVYACDKPQAPELPDGATATREEMARADAAIAEYSRAFDRYLSCLGQLLNTNAGLDTRTYTNRWMTEALREKAQFMQRASEERRKFHARNKAAKPKS